MKKISKLFSAVAVVVAASVFYTFNSSNEIIYANIEALTGGDTGSGSNGPKATIMTMGRKATKTEKKDAWNGLYTALSEGFSETAEGKHNIDNKEYSDCGTYTYGFVIYDKNYGKCVAWKINTSGVSPLGSYTTCPEHTTRK